MCRGLSLRELHLGDFHSIGLHMASGVGGYRDLGVCLSVYQYTFLIIGRDHGLMVLRGPKSLGAQRVMPLQCLFRTNLWE